MNLFKLLIIYFPLALAQMYDPRRCSEYAKKMYYIMVENINEPTPEYLPSKIKLEFNKEKAKSFCGKCSDSCVGLIPAWLFRGNTYEGCNDCLNEWDRKFNVEDSYSGKQKDKKLKIKMKTNEK